MMGLLQSYGYSFVDTWQQADAVLVNSCTVKGPSQDSAVKLGSGDHQICGPTVDGNRTRGDVENG